MSEPIAQQPTDAAPAAPILTLLGSDSGAAVCEGDACYIPSPLAVQPGISERSENSDSTVVASPVSPQ